MNLFGLLSKMPVITRSYFIVHDFHRTSEWNDVLGDFDEEKPLGAELYLVV